MEVFSGLSQLEYLYDLAQIKWRQCNNCGSVKKFREPTKSWFSWQWSVKRYSHSGEELGGFFKDSMWNHPWPGIELLAFSPEEWKYVHTKICTGRFIAALLIIAPNWKKPRCLSAVECYKVRSLHARELYPAVRRKGHWRTQQPGRI